MPPLPPGASSSNVLGTNLNELHLSLVFLSPTYMSWVGWSLHASGLWSDLVRGQEEGGKEEQQLPRGKRSWRWRGREKYDLGGCLPSSPRRYVFGAAVNVNARGVKMVWETKEEKKSPIGMICRTRIYAWAGLEKALRGSIKSASNTSFFTRMLCKNSPSLKSLCETLA